MRTSLGIVLTIFTWVWMIGFIVFVRYECERWWVGDRTYKGIAKFMIRALSWPIILTAFII